MRPKFEYLVCQSQAGKITFVNGDFAGQVMGNQTIPEERERTYDSCPNFVDFLRSAGAEGWELASGYTVQSEHGVYEKLIFKRMC